MKNGIRLLNQAMASTAGLRLLVVGMTALADLLFYRQPSGWPLGVYLLLAGLLLAIRPAPDGRRQAFLPVLFALSVAAGAVVYRGGALAPLLAASALVLLVGARAETGLRHAEDWARAAACVPDRMLRAHLRDRRLLRRRRGASRRAAGSMARAVLAWTIPVVLAAVFLWLFCLANPVIERGVGQALDALVKFLKWLRLPEILRVLFWLAVAAGLWGVWRVRSERVRRGPTPPPLPVAPAPPESFPLLALRCLGLFNVLFAVETATDLVYLWGGRALPGGMTYAAYAHRGAYPLLATALLSAGITLFFFRPANTANRLVAARALVVAWLAQNVLLTVSAAWRLHLYVGVYTLTELRVAAFIWMGLVAFGLLSIGWRIVRGRDNRWLLDVNAVVLFAVLLACAWWPMEGFIARHNVRGCREAGGTGPSLDIDYLKKLGPEAIPALSDFCRRDVAKSESARQAAIDLTNQLRKSLENPRAWTWRRLRLLQNAEETGP
jgi:hypothetical protein